MLLPLTRPSLHDEEFDAARAVLGSGWITTGPKAREFETALADYLGGDVSVRVFNSATSALEAALLAARIGPGDEVIVPAMSFVATANVVLRVGATPVFVDVGARTRNINTLAVANALSPRTRAIIPVHFAGLSADLDPLAELAAEHRLVVIEDAAQAIGTRYRGRHVGAAGNPVCFSFHPNKNITAIEGGALACNDAEFMERVERIRFHGIERDDDGNVDVCTWGGKMNLPDVGAAIGLVQLPKLNGFNARRRQLAERYFERLPDEDWLVRPAAGDGHSWHMFCVGIDYASLGTTRVDVQRRLRERDIASGVHYPAIHQLSLYRRMGIDAQDFPVAARIGAQTLTLPLFPGMHEQDVDRVCHALAEAVAAR